MNKIKVLIVEAQGKDRELASSTLSKIDYISLVGEVETMEEADSLIKEYYPNVIIVGSNVDFNKVVFSKGITREYPDIAIIMVESELTEDTIYNGIFAGAKDIIISPFTSSRLVESVYRTSELVKEDIATVQDRTKVTKKTSKKGNIITVFSTKGGVGKTFISTNLAIALSKETDKRICLVDLDLDFGNTVLALNIVPRFTISDVIDDIKNIDEDLIESYLIPHESGIKVLATSIKPQINEFINADHIETILKALQGAFDYIVVDMPARFYEPVNPAFQVSDILLMVTTPEISTVRNIKSSILTLHELNFPKSKIKVVLNKSDRKSQIMRKDIESTIGQSLFSEINADYRLATLTLNNGNPMILFKPRNTISKSISSLAKKIELEFKDHI